MNSQYYMGIDLGTSSLKVMLVNPLGKPVVVSTVSYQFDSPHNGYAEQNPTIWWESCCEAIKDAIFSAHIKSNEIVSIGLSGQMHGVVMLDDNFNPVYPAILHCDARSEQQILHVKNELGEEFIKSTLYNQIYSGFMLPSLLWMKDNKPELFYKIKYIMSPKDYLKFQLCSEIVTDFCDASATLLFDFNSLSWSNVIINLFDLNHIKFPEIKYASEVVGYADSVKARNLGLSNKTIVVNGGGDQLMQMIGNGVIDSGDACVNIGTSGQVSFQSTKMLPAYDHNINLFCSYDSKRWIVMGAIMNAGLCFNWLKDLLNETNYQRIDKLVKETPVGSNGIIFLPYLTGERTPYYNPNLSGAFLGLSTNTDRGALFRSVWEGVSFALFQCMEIIKNLGVNYNQLIASGGATQSQVWLQLQSDIYNVPLRITKVQEQAAFGAAISASVGSRLFKNINEACQTWVSYEPNIIIPNSLRHNQYGEYYELFKDIFQVSADQIEALTLLGRKRF